MINSREAEQSVLGAILIDAEKVMPKVIGIVSEDDFFYSENKNIFSICKDMFLRGEKLDTITVLGRYGNTGEHKVYLFKLAEIVPSISNAEAYAKIVAGEAKRRKALELTNTLLVNLSEGEPLNECLELACEINKTLNITSKRNSLTALEGFTQVYMGLDKPRNYIKTGFQTLDRYTKISKGDYIVVAGRPSAGKTALTLQIMMNMAKAYKVLYFSLETKGFKLFERMMSTYTHTPFDDIKSGNIKDYVPLAKHSNTFAKLNFTAVDAAGWTVEQIKAKAIEERADIIFIDYLSLISSKGKDRYEKTTNVSIDLHITAQTSDIAVVVLSQLNRSGKGDSPDVTNIRESGQIEQDADVILLLSKEDEDDSENHRRKLNIAKNKEGITGTIYFNFDGEYQTFVEVEARQYGR